jgi:hypothetical protein
MMFRINKNHNKKPKLLFTILKIYLLDGMVNQYLIGSINFMGLELNINVKYVVIILIGAEELLKCISKNGDTLMA